MTTPAINSNVELKGSFEPLVKRFADKTQRGILRATLRRTAQQVIVKEARANLKSVGGKRFTKGLTVKTTVTNRVANARIGAKQGSLLAKVGHLIERGTKPHTLETSKSRVMVGRKDGIFYGTQARHPGTAAKPWLNPALEERKGPTVQRFGELIVEEIEKAIAKGKR